MKKPLILTRAAGSAGLQKIVDAAHNDTNVELVGGRKARRVLASLKRRDVVISDGNATAIGMNRLLDGNDVKDTVKDNAGE